MSDWSVFTHAAHGRLVREGVYALMKANTAIAAFTADGGTPPEPKVYMLPMGMIPDKQAPFVYVYIAREDRQPELQRMNEVRLTIGIGLVAEESRETVAVNQAGFEDFANEVQNVLMTDPLLETTGVGSGALVLRLESTTPLDVAAVAQGADSDLVTWVKEVLATYYYEVAATTGAKV